MELEGFRFFPRRRLALSVVTHPIRGLSEDQLALALAASRRQATVRVGPAAAAADAAAGAGPRAVGIVEKRMRVPGVNDGCGAIRAFGVRKRPKLERRLARQADVFSDMLSVVVGRGQAKSSNDDNNNTNTTS